MLISRFVVNLEDEAVRVALGLGNGRELGQPHQKCGTGAILWIGDPGCNDF